MAAPTVARQRCSGSPEQCNEPVAPQPCVPSLLRWNAAVERSRRATLAEAERAICLRKRSETLKRVQRTSNLEERMQLLETLPQCVDQDHLPVPPSTEDLRERWSAIPSECRDYADDANSAPSEPEERVEP